MDKEKDDELKQFEKCYSFDEQDDQRLIEEKIPDYLAKETESKVRFYKPKSAKQTPMCDASFLEYVKIFKDLIDECGQVSYFWNMKTALSANVQKVRNVAKEYKHSDKYYDEQEAEAKWKAKRELGRLKFKGDTLGITVNPYKTSEKSREFDRIFLNNLTLNPDRRKCYTYYLSSYAAKGKALSPKQLEEFYQKRLARRAKNKNNKKKKKGSS